MSQNNHKNLCDYISKFEYQQSVFLLGRVPKVKFTVKAYCKVSNTPKVLEADPVYIENNIIKPFPTIFWLVCNYLKKQVSKLESKGFIKKIKEQLLKDEYMKTNYLISQEYLANYRISKAKQLLYIINTNLPDHIEFVLKTKNIAGSADLFNLKCLHAHFAQYLVTKMNPVGELVYKEIGDCYNSHREINSFLGEYND